MNEPHLQINEPKEEVSEKCQDFEYEFENNK